VEDEPQAEFAPFLRGQECAQVRLDFYRVVVARESEPSRQPTDVSVDGQSGKVEGHTAHDVRRFATDAGQGDEVVHIRWHFAGERVHHGIGHADEVSRLGTEEAGGSHDLFDVANVGDGERLGVGITPKQMRRHHVHPRIRALRRQNRRGEKLERRLVSELAHRNRVVLLQMPENCRGVVGQLGLARARRHEDNGNRRPHITTLSAWHNSYSHVRAMRG
jgi:hypothetical protein